MVELKQIRLEDLVIDSEFENLIRKQTPDEAADFEYQMINHGGAHDPIMVWDNGGTYIILDGHHRYWFLLKHPELNYRVEVAHEVHDRLEAGMWILRQQRGKKNLKPFELAELALKFEPMLKAEAKKRQQESGGDKKSEQYKESVMQNSAQPKFNHNATRDEVARIAGVSHDTIDKTKKILAEGTEEQINAVRSGEKSINTVDRFHYQRKIEKSVVKEIVNNFDYHKVNCVKVVYRDGKYYAFDGQQTTNGLLQKFGSDYLAPCLVYYDVPDWVEEAILFEGTNSKKSKKSVGVRDLWRSRLNREEDCAMDIKSIVERSNFILTTESNHSAVPGKIQALEAIERAYNKLGKQKFEEMMFILDQSWHGSAESVTSPMLGGMAHFINTYYREYKRQRLIEKLSNPTSIGKIIVGGSSGSRKGAKKYAAEILEIYNANLASSSSNYLDVKKL